MNVSLINRPVVVIADFRPDHTVIDSQIVDLDLYTEAELEEILSTLKKVCQTVTLFSSPRDFINAIRSHTGSIVLPFWAGRMSRNRTALISAISEAYEMDYFGADTYSYIVGQDKSLAKQIARDFQINTPTSVLVHSKERLGLINLLRPPFVVKPNLEGSSIGIGNRNLCRTISEAADVTIELLDRFRQPILVENFVEGTETTVTIFGSSEKIHLFQAIEITDPTGKIDLSKTIWSCDLKKGPNRPYIIQRPVELSDNDRDKLQRFFFALGKLELVRIDGRLRDGIFHFIEINPEPYLSKCGSVYKSFAHHGHSYEDMFRQLLLPFEMNPQREAPVY